MALLRFLVATLLIGSVSGGAEPVAAGDDACVSGDCTNGHGTAKYVWGEYTGEWRDSLRQGYGVLTSTDGSKYDGEWKAGTKHGRGAITFATGTKVLSYDGEWKDGVTHGHGVMLFANGAKYDGEWTDGTKHGHGVYSWPSGDRYVGEFKAGAFHGHGVKTFADGDMVEGLFRDGEFIEDAPEAAQAAAERAHGAARTAGESAHMRATLSSRRSSLDPALRSFMTNLGLQHHLPTFADAEVDLELLRSLTANELDRDLSRLELPLGAVRKITKRIEEERDDRNSL